MCVFFCVFACFVCESLFDVVWCVCACWSCVCCLCLCVSVMCGVDLLVMCCVMMCALLLLLLFLWGLLACLCEIAYTHVFVCCCLICFV